MKRYLLLVLMVAVVSGGIGRAASKPRTDENAAKPDPTGQSNHKQQATTGDEIFQANCARCHMPPMSISQRTTGTVIMHMRARARLSREDEIQLLKFMAP
jgi:cytochrome c5